MLFGLKLQEKIRKPLIFFSNVLQKTGLIKFYNGLITPINRFTFFTSPFLKNINPDFVIDIGANSGEFILLASNAFPNVPLVAFEPIKNEYNKIFSKYNTKKNITLVNKGLGSNVDEVNLYVGEFSPSSSIIKPETENFSIQKIEIEILDNYLDLFKNSNNVFCKIDVEGYELEVLKGSTRALKHIKYLYIEARTTDIVGCSFDEIYSFLNDRGFKYLGNYDTTYKNNGEISHFDSLFVNQSS